MLLNLKIKMQDMENGAQCQGVLNTIGVIFLDALASLEPTHRSVAQGPFHSPW